MLDFLTTESKPSEVSARRPFLVPRLTPSSAIEFTSPPWIIAAERRINALLQLQENWDGEGAPSPSLECAMEAMSFLLLNAIHETPAPQFIPTSAGGIQIEWHFLGSDFEIRFDPTEAATFFHSNGDTTDIDIEGEVNQNLPLVTSLLRALPVRNDLTQSAR